jgi:enamine deaminase RidA (YjgF/YER057c/UK114 family)
MENPLNKTDLVIPAAMQAMYDRFHFAPAVRAGEFLLCSGQLGLGPDGRVIADPEAQFTAAFENLKSVLAEAGLGLGDVVELTTFHAGGMQQHLPAFMRVKDRYLPDPYPAWTAIGIVELAMPGALVELRANARRAKAPAAPRKAKSGRKKRAGKKRAAKKRAGKKRPAKKRAAKRKGARRKAARRR